MSEGDASDERAATGRKGSGGRPRTPESVEAVVACLAAGKTIAEAAAETGVGANTIKRWRRSPKFRARVSAVRTQATADAIGKLSATCTKAADRLDKLLDSADEKTVLAASKAILDTSLKGREQLELAERLAAVEAALKGGGT